MLWTYRFYYWSRFNFIYKGHLYKSTHEHLFWIWVHTCMGVFKRLLNNIRFRAEATSDLIVDRYTAVCPFPPFLSTDSPVAVKTRLKFEHNSVINKKYMAKKRLNRRSGCLAGKKNTLKVTFVSGFVAVFYYCFLLNVFGCVTQILTLF